MFFWKNYTFRGGKRENLHRDKNHTIYINESGLYSLILTSKKPIAKEFKRWVTSEVLPSLRKHGKYEINKSFYNDNLLADYNSQNVLYIADIGFIENKQTYKYGKSSRIYERDVKEHRKVFSTFNIIHIVKTDNNDVIETMFKHELDVKKLLVSIKIGDKKQVELFITTNEHPINTLIDIMNKLTESYVLPIIKEITNDKEYLMKQEDTKQMQEKTKQVELETKQIELQIKKLGLEIMKIEMENVIKNSKNLFPNKKPGLKKNSGNFS